MTPERQETFEEKWGMKKKALLGRKDFDQKNDMSMKHNAKYFTEMS